MSQSFRLIPALAPLALGLALGLGAPGQAGAQSPAPNPPAEAGLPTLAETLAIGEVIAIMREEGIDYGRSLEAEMFPGRGGADWQRIVALIYDETTMRRRFDEAFGQAMAGDEATLAAALAFFGDARGQHFIRLEIDARRALLDDAVEDAAKARVDEMIAARDPRLQLIRRFVEANDLIEANVAGALNANLAFYRGMVEVGAFGEETAEADMLADVWGQEEQIRAETEGWLMPYLTLAYGPASDADLEAYIAFSQSPEGQRLNRALFAAFDAVFGKVSQDLGRAAARQMLGQDI